MDVPQNRRLIKMLFNDDRGAAVVEVALIMAFATLPIVVGLFAVGGACANRLTAFPGTVATWISNGQ